MLERLSLQQLHGDEVLTVRFVDLINRADVRMIERGGSEGFPLKSFTGGRIVLHLSGQELQRDMAMQLEVFGLVDHTHPAATELREDAIVRDGLADHLACVAVRRRTSSKKFSRKITWLCAFCPSAVSTGINATMRLPSGARSTFFTADGAPELLLGPHSRFVGHEGIALHRVAATMMWLSKVSKNSSCPLRDHIGYVPPLFEICHLPPLSGKART